MDSGFYAACAGLKARTQALEMVANNLANLNTTGYRAHEASFQSLLVGNAVNSANPLNRAINDFGVLSGSQLDLKAGNLESTGNALDLAIEGSGFFAVQGRGEVFYTRTGNFRVSAAGQLVTSEGDPVLGEQGPISVPSGQVAIGADGTLSVDGAVAGKLRLAGFAPNASLTAVGHSLLLGGESGRDCTGPGYNGAPGHARELQRECSGREHQLDSAQRQAEMLQRALSTFYSEFNHIAATDLPRV